MGLKANRQVNDTGLRRTVWPKGAWPRSTVDRGPPSTQSLRNSSHHQFAGLVLPGPQGVMAAMYW